MKKVQFFIDDVIWLFRDLTRQNPKSIFDNAFLKMLKKAHDEYGLKVQLNCFYRTSFWYGNDEFSLADMTDKYKAEFIGASNWLKFGFHSIEEWPDYPYVNADYSQVDENFNRVKKEIVRFAGEDSFAKSVLPHWAPISRDGVKALYDNGVRITYTTRGKREPWDGKQDSLPYGHSFRILHNRKPETMVFSRENVQQAISKSICAYNHVDEETYNKYVGKFDTIYDEESGMSFTCSAELVHNLLSKEEIKAKAKLLIDKGYEYISTATHEQYFYPDYFDYQPDYEERLFVMIKTFVDAGYKYVFTEDMPRKA